MRLTSTGLGIGTSSPGAKLGVLSADGATTSIVAGATGKLRTFGYADATRGALLDSINTAENTYLPLTLNGSSLLLQTGATTRATLDASGNLGLGVTPSAWGAGKAIEVGFVGNSLYGNSSNNMNVVAGAYFNSGFKYAVSSLAVSYYNQSNGVHAWLTAPSGTAGDAISFTQAMTLDASGNLLVGSTSNPSTRRLSVNGIISIQDGSNERFFINWVPGQSRTEIVTVGANSTTFWTNSTERARITSGGELLVGLTSATGVALLQVSGPIRTTGYTVATLPAGTVGMRTYVTDALAPSFGVAVAGSGAVTIPVFYDGANWIVA
jgi:hypothetical protein